VGRNGLPLIIGEILRNMELKIVNVLSPYIRELQGGMPPSSKLPIHDYGTEGGYGYFQLKLKDIFTYPDLRPEVLNNFRQLGNAIILTNLFDLGSVQLESETFVLSAPFLGFTPDDMKPNENESPLYVHLQRVATLLESKPEYGAKCPSALREIVTNAWRADRYYRPAAFPTSLFKSVLQKIDLMLGPVRAEWSGSAPENGVMNADTTSEFYRIWSALQFVVCLPTSENDASCHELFGDGLMWAGCTMIHFLGQKHRFEVFDFSYHILNVEEAAPVACQKPNVRQFFKTAMLMKDINQSIFSLLETYAPTPQSPITTLRPPSTDASDHNYISLTDENNQAYNPPADGYEVDFGGAPPPPIG